MEEMRISEGEMESRKPHYDISMSRRTRKARDYHDQNLKMGEQEIISFEERENQKSLKQLIEGKRSCSLAQHFREEEEEEEEINLHQSLVVRPPDHLQGGAGGGDDQRLRLKRSIMRNYAQVLTHLIKVKQESYFRSWKKSANISVKLIKHKHNQ